MVVRRAGLTVVMTADLMAAMKVDSKAEMKEQMTVGSMAG